MSVGRHHIKATCNTNTSHILLVITQGLTDKQVIVTSHIAHGIYHENTNIYRHTKVDKKEQQQGKNVINDDHTIGSISGHSPSFFHVCT